MQNLLAFIPRLFQQFAKLLKGGDNWFLVIDEDFVAQETNIIQEKNLADKKVQLLRKDNFNRAYESNRRLSSERLSLGELWATLNPLSVLSFLRYALSDVI